MFLKLLKKYLQKVEKILLEEGNNTMQITKVTVTFDDGSVQEVVQNITPTQTVVLQSGETLEVKAQ